MSESPKQRKLSVLRSEIVTDPETSQRMKRIRRAGTKPEMVVAAALREVGVRSARCNKNLPGTPDFSNQAKGWAILVNGCFWHGHPNCPAARLPTTNRTFWTAKVADNVRRDRRQLHALRSLGLRVLVLWECQLKRVGDKPKALRRIRSFILRT